MRICSLVPAATEVLFALGLGEQVVGVTHECDWPPEACARRRVTVSLVESGSLASAEIDRAVTEAARTGRPLYLVEEQAWADVGADLVVAQEVCDVCAVSTETVRALDVEVVDYSPTTLDGIGTAIGGLGCRLGVPAAGERLAREFQSRIGRVRATVGQERRSRVVVAEWLDPPYVAGHWVPEMVAAAGGEEVAGRPGGRSVRTTWQALAALDPDFLVLAPCGFDLERTLAEAPERLPGRSVVAVDANSFFSRPGPRVADGVELLAHLLHPGLAPDPDIPFVLVRGAATRA